MQVLQSKPNWTTTVETFILVRSVARERPQERCLKRNLIKLENNGAATMTTPLQRNPPDTRMTQERTQDAYIAMTAHYDEICTSKSSH